MGKKGIGKRRYKEVISRIDFNSGTPDLKLNLIKKLKYIFISHIIIHIITTMSFITAELMSGEIHHIEIFYKYRVKNLQNELSVIHKCNRDRITIFLKNDTGEFEECNQMYLAEKGDNYYFFISIPRDPLDVWLTDRFDNGSFILELRDQDGEVHFTQVMDENGEEWRRDFDQQDIGETSSIQNIQNRCSDEEIVFYVSLSPASIRWICVKMNQDEDDQEDDSFDDLDDFHVSNFIYDYCKHIIYNYSSASVRVVIV